MSETRYTRTFDKNGNLIEVKPYIVSDEELDREQLEADAFSIYDKIKKDKTKVSLEELARAVEYLLSR